MIRLFTALVRRSLTSAILTKTPDHIMKINPKVSPELDDLILTCMAKRPEARPSTKQLGEHLASYSSDEIVSLPKGLFGNPK